MFYDEIRLVGDMVKKYGFMPPVVELGGLGRPCVADYDITIRTGDQAARYVNVVNPFESVFGEYTIMNPDNGDPLIEDMADVDVWGTAVCVSVLEHVTNPFEVFRGFYRILKPEGLLIVSTVFSFPYHASEPDGHDYWRFTPTCLKMLGEYAEFEVLEADWGLWVTADKGVLDMKTGEPQEIKSVYTVCRKPS